MSWSDTYIIDDPEDHSRILELLLRQIGLKVQIESGTENLRLVPLHLTETTDD